MSCCLFAHLFCWPCYLCYICDIKNFLPIPETDKQEPVQVNEDNKSFEAITEEPASVLGMEDIRIDQSNMEEKSEEFGDETVVEIESIQNEQINDSQFVHTKQPTKFHYTNKYFKSYLYIAIESKVETSLEENNEFYFWIKIPFNFNIDLDDKRDQDLL